MLLHRGMGMAVHLSPLRARELGQSLLINAAQREGDKGLSYVSPVAGNA